MAFAHTMRGMRGIRQGHEGDRRGGPVRVKICGITRPEDGVLAARLGADAVGLVFHAKSPRSVTVERARVIVAALPPFVTRVGLFVNAAPTAIEAVLCAVPLDVLQFHGEEPAEDCRCYGRPYIKAIRMRPDVDIPCAAAAYPDAAADPDCSGRLRDPDLSAGRGSGRRRGPLDRGIRRVRAVVPRPRRARRQGATDQTHGARLRCCGCTARDSAGTVPS